MKSNIKLVFVCLLYNVLFSCTNREQKVKESSLEYKVTGTPYFEFDNIDHYKIEIEEVKIDELDTSDPKKSSAKLSKVLRKYESNEIKSQKYLDELIRLGFKKSQIKSNKISLAKSIFSKRECNSEWIVFSCAPNYRDIYVLKQGKAITGIAKICFDCGAYNFVGANHNVEEFGKCNQFDDLMKLN